MHGVLKRFLSNDARASEGCWDISWFICFCACFFIMSTADLLEVCLSRNKLYLVKPGQSWAVTSGKFSLISLLILKGVRWATQLTHHGLFIFVTFPQCFCSSTDGCDACQRNPAVTCTAEFAPGWCGLCDSFEKQLTFVYCVCCFICFWNADILRGCDMYTVIQPSVVSKSLGIGHSCVNN